MKKAILFLALFTLTFALSGQSSDADFAFAPLPYAYDALEPHIDARTMQIHYEKHHRGYHNNLLKALNELAANDKKNLQQVLGQLKEKSDTLRNNAGGHFNHTFFWKTMSPDGGGLPTGTLLEKIQQSFGSVGNFQQQFKTAALSRFGSGWAWLCIDSNGKLFVCSTANQDNPLMDLADQKGIPILGLDVWEHAYYLKYQNLRGNYIDAFWNVVDWNTVQTRLESAMTK
ncbi:MAG: superoxide dismutase [Lentisphaeria bacterium]|jgi:Fe-Mn family superoxide dismutase|nr:superoxide dismutase [Lentisphaeria bacterium]MDY0177520.1 superoxide dismutase [Lentisphaeria bacterium]